MAITQEYLNECARGKYVISRTVGRDLGVKRIVTPDNIAYVGVWDTYYERETPYLRGINIAALKQHSMRTIVGVDAESLTAQIESQLEGVPGTIKIAPQKQVQAFIKRAVETPLEKHVLLIATVTQRGQLKINDTEDSDIRFYWYIRNNVYEQGRDIYNLGIPIYTHAETIELASENNYQPQGV